MWLSIPNIYYDMLVSVVFCRNHSYLDFLLNDASLRTITISHWNECYSVILYLVRRGVGVSTTYSSNPRGIGDHVNHAQLDM